ncbi:pentapeptide repeat-containing protein [Micromonospora zingiberis]|uniref:pentapeptide repeat-containing protein n=1 Tax=Micromonospora zingiberis TaxID=2053011 RepID=UPI0013F4BD3C|nr:pentapeptide repeat-containing protein [Micromonospora zingiberis]
MVKPGRLQQLVTVGSIVSVVLVGLGLYETNRANREQQRLAAQGQITERFTRAIEQLGQPGEEKVDVRLGAIYALERIMRDSVDDQPAIIDILAAFVRVHALAPVVATREPTSDLFEENDLFEEAPGPRRLPVDIKAALTVLGRLDLRRDMAPIDLANVYLAGADLRGADLSGMDLSGADLSGADLEYARLIDTKLRSANLNGASLAFATVSGADLGGADLGDANLLGAVLIGTDLMAANLNGAFLIGANLTDAELLTTTLDCAVISGRWSPVEGADCTGWEWRRDTGN